MILRDDAAMPSSIDIARFSDVVPPTNDVRTAVDAIFYETAPRAPAEAERRAEFYDLWLGQYLRNEPHLAYVAVAAERVVGYLVGCHVNPATSPRFAELPYFQTFAAACARYPAHLHINLTAAARSSGTGALLLDACANDVAAAGLPGVHVITSATARNVLFYQRQGFVEVDRAERNGGCVVFLGRRVGA